MKRLRVVTLSLLIMALVAGGLPLAVSFAKWSRRSAAAQRKKQKHYRKYSRAWWRRERARQRARRARALARRRRLETLRAAHALTAGAAERERPARAPRDPRAASPNAALSVIPASLPNAALSVPPPVPSPVVAGGRAAGFERATSHSPRMPFEYAAPSAWGAGRRAGSNAVQFNLRTPAGKPAGTATLAPVGLPRDAGEGAAAARKSIGGVTIAALRRTVIDRMVAAGGWVTNDYVREIEGRRVFVVVAQTGAPGSPTESQTFYFTEVDGRVYSLATSAPLDLSVPAAAGSEQLMSSLRPAGRGNLVLQK
jgi:hypothetical protein